MIDAVSQRSGRDHRDLAGQARYRAPVVEIRGASAEEAQRWRADWQVRMERW